MTDTVFNELLLSSTTISTYGFGLKKPLARILPETTEKRRLDYIQHIARLALPHDIDAFIAH